MKHSPYMSPSEGDDVMRHHMRLVAEGDRQHTMLEAQLTKVRMRLKRDTTVGYWMLGLGNEMSA